MAKRDLTPEEQQLFKESLKWASMSEALKAAYWAAFRPKKLYILIDYLNKGANWMYAYRCAKENKKCDLK